MNSKKLMTFPASLLLCLGLVLAGCDSPADPSASDASSANDSSVSDQSSEDVSSSEEESSVDITGWSVVSITLNRSIVTRVAVGQSLDLADNITVSCTNAAGETVNATKSAIKELVTLRVTTDHITVKGTVVNAVSVGDWSVTIAAPSSGVRRNYTGTAISEELGQVEAFADRLENNYGASMFYAYGGTSYAYGYVFKAEDYWLTLESAENGVYQYTGAVKFANGNVYEADYTETYDTSGNVASYEATLGTELQGYWGGLIYGLSFKDAYQTDYPFVDRVGTDGEPISIAVDAATALYLIYYNFGYSAYYYVATGAFVSTGETQTYTIEYSPADEEQGYAEGLALYVVGSSSGTVVECDFYYPGEIYYEGLAKIVEAGVEPTRPEAAASVVAFLKTLNVTKRYAVHAKAEFGYYDSSENWVDTTDATVLTGSRGLMSYWGLSKGEGTRYVNESGCINVISTLTNSLGTSTDTFNGYILANDTDTALTYVSGTYADGSYTATSSSVTNLSSIWVEGIGVSAGDMHFSSPLSAVEFTDEIIENLNFGTTGYDSEGKLTGTISNYGSAAGELIHNLLAWSPLNAGQESVIFSEGGISFEDPNTMWYDLFTSNSFTYDGNEGVLSFETHVSGLAQDSSGRSIYIRYTFDISAVGTDGVTPIVSSLVYDLTPDSSSSEETSSQETSAEESSSEASASKVVKGEFESKFEIRA